MFNNILLPTDGSKLSSQAIKAAVQFAKETGATITAVNVQPEYQPPVAVEVPAGYLYSPREYQALAKKEAEKILAEVEASAKKAGVKCQLVATLSNVPFEAIVKTAKSKKCDLIFMASHGRRGVAGFLLGSETQKVLTHCKVPVLVYR